LSRLSLLPPVRSQSPFPIGHLSTLVSITTPCIFEQITHIDPPARREDPVSFNNYMGLQSMSNFDDFFGQGNFDSSQNVQTVIVQEKQVVCQTQAIEVVQQKIVVLMEVMKR
jgi:hypothetical protein